MRIEQDANNNRVSLNDASDNGTGVVIDGDGNDVRSGTINDNAGNGVTINGDNNDLRGSDVKFNGAKGVEVNGTGNLIQDIDAIGNGDCEFMVGPGNLDGGDNKANGAPVDPTVGGCIE